MTVQTEIRSAPHIKGPRSVEQIMANVVYSLLPICAFFVYQYGISAAASILVVTGACLLAERYFVRLGGQAGSLSDFSATITGLLLALTLPPGFPLWMGVVAGFSAIAHEFTHRLYCPKKVMAVEHGWVRFSDRR